MRLYTWGYDARSLNQLWDLVLRYEIVLVVDVRRRPQSGDPQWNAAHLQRVLDNRYVWVRELGNRSPVSAGRPVHLVDEVVGLQKLLDLLRRYGTVLLLGIEQRPDECHRQHIVAAMRQRVWDLKIVHL